MRGAQLEAAEAALLEFESFAGARTRRLPHSASAGAHAAELARDPELKFSAADALHLALSAEGRHRLVNFDARVADSTRAAGFDAEIPSGAIEYAPILAALEFWPSMARITNGGGDEHPETPPSTAVPAGGWRRLSETPPRDKGFRMFVVFDIGNVLMRWNPRNLFRKTIRDEARMERLLGTALAMDFVSLTDIAADFSKAVKERAMAFPEFARELNLFDERWVETIGGPIEENVALMRRLKTAGRPVYALSNFAAVKFAIARSMFDFLGEFDHAVISGHVGVVKPDPRIFAILFERSGRRPEELVLVDDQLKNVETARALGMPAIHFGPGVDLERELREHGALP
jgi:2-haloacid dehalogenase